jgi:hypothetical protein
MYKHAEHRPHRAANKYQQRENHPPHHLRRVLEAVQQRLDKNRWRCAKGARQLSGLDHYAPNRHDTGSTTARSVDEVALIRDTISHYAPVLIASARATAQLGLVWSPATGINFFVDCRRATICTTQGRPRHDLWTKLR